MRLLVKVPYVSLVNLILNKRAVIELIQKDLSDKNLEEAFVELTEDASFRDNMLADYDELSEKVGGAGASGRAARAILKAYGES